MKILISGKPRSGKTTLIKKLASELGNSATGFYTEEILKNGTRVGFKAISLPEQRETVLAHVNGMSRYRVGKYKIDIPAFEALFTEVFEGVLKGLEETVVLIDEIGKMELFSQKFEQAIIELLASQRTIVATIKSGWKERWMSHIRDKDADHFELRRDNFDQIFLSILTLIKPK